MLPAAKPSQTTANTTATQQTTPSAPVAAAVPPAEPASTHALSLDTPLPNNTESAVTEVSVGEKRAMSSLPAGLEAAKRVRTQEPPTHSEEVAWGVAGVQGVARAVSEPGTHTGAATAQPSPAPGLPDKSMLTHTLSLVARTLQHLRDSGVVC